MPTIREAPPGVGVVQPSAGDHGGLDSQPRRSVVLDPRLGVEPPRELLDLVVVKVMKGALDEHCRTVVVTAMEGLQIAYLVRAT